jgi:hypothetical protein
MNESSVFIALAAIVCTGFAADASCIAITSPPSVVDSGFPNIYPRVVVKNTGPEFLPSIPVSLHVVLDSDPADTVYRDTASSGPVSAGESVSVDFATPISSLDAGNYSVTGITELPDDSNPQNDTCGQPLFVRYVEVAVEITSPRDTEQPGNVPVKVRLTNLGNLPTMVPRLGVKITAGFYPDYREDIWVPAGWYTDVSWFWV